MEGPSSKRQSFIVSTQAVETIFEGSKTYWKSRTNLEIVMICHTKYHTIEVLVFHPDIGKESPRLYLNSLLLAGKIDQNDLQQKLAEKKEAIIRQRKPVNAQQLTKELLNNAIAQYVMSRLQFVMETEDQPFRVFLVPMTGDVIVDQEKQLLDIIVPMPPNLEPVQSNFQKKLTTQDIDSALNSFKASADELRRATRYAELATSSVDGFKLMMAEKLAFESEMKKKYSVPRLRWIRAINCVLIQNYCALVRIRLDELEQKAKAAMQAAVIDDAPAAKGTRPKILRRSIDNSLLKSASEDKNGSSLPCIQKTSSLGSPTHGSILPSLASASGEGALPALLETSSRRMRKGGGTSGKNANNRVTRHSLNQDLLNKYVPEHGGSTELFPSPESSSKVHNSSSVPSLIQSYATSSQKMLQPVSLSALSDLRDMGGRSMRQVR